ncbi:MAG: hypothetical protein QW210_03585, partial [Candidatus Woesearchaeota archaeon]
LSDSSDVIKDESSMNLSIRDVNISLDKLGSETKVNITVNITFNSSDNKISKSILVSKNNTRVKYNFDELKINPEGGLDLFVARLSDKITMNMSQIVNISVEDKALDVKEIASILSNNLTINLTIVNVSNRGVLLERNILLTDIEWSILNNFEKENINITKLENNLLNITVKGVELNKLGNEIKVNITVNITFNSSDNKISKSILVSKEYERVKMIIPTLSIN